MSEWIFHTWTNILYIKCECYYKWVKPSERVPGSCVIGSNPAKQTFSGNDRDNFVDIASHIGRYTIVSKHSDSVMKDLLWTAALYLQSEPDRLEKHFGVFCIMGKRHWLIWGFSQAALCSSFLGSLSSWKVLVLSVFFLQKFNFLWNYIEGWLKKKKPKTKQNNPGIVISEAQHDSTLLAALSGFYWWAGDCGAACKFCIAEAATVSQSSGWRRLYFLSWSDSAAAMLTYTYVNAGSKTTHQAICCFISQSRPEKLNQK